VDIDIEKKPEGGERIGSVIFKTGKYKYVQVDDQFYRLLVKYEDGRDEYLVTVETPHPLGYAPATFLPQNPLYDEEDNSPAARKTQISDVVGDLDWLLFFKIAERMYETYGPFPIMTVPKTSCEYVDKSTGVHCNGGFISYTNRRGEPSAFPCPVCAKNNYAGPGTIIERSVPRSKEDPQLSKAVEITPPDIDSLDYITKKIDFLEWEIYANCVGSNDQQVQKEAVNEKQVQSNVEGKRNVLASIRKDFESCEKFIVDTMGRLMYGDYYLTATVNYGDQVLLYTLPILPPSMWIQKRPGCRTFISRKKSNCFSRPKTGTILTN
jgi:hypothetical protein